MGKPARERSQSNWFQSSEAGGGAAQILSGAENYKSPVLPCPLGLWKTFHNPACSFTLPSPRTSRKQKKCLRKRIRKNSLEDFLSCVVNYLFFSGVCVCLWCVCVHLWVCTCWWVCARVLACAWMQGVGIGVFTIALCPRVSLTVKSLLLC